MAQSLLQFRIIAQPKPLYRERYVSEMLSNRNRAHRYIRADPNQNQDDYPTIEILPQLRGLRIYIRITLVTVPTDQVPVTCVHPYPIDTPELDVIRDVNRNTLYFPVTEDDFKNGQKSFRIIRKKLIRHELINYGPLRLLNEEGRDIPRTNDSSDARQLIETYQLGKSQLLFSIAELIDDDLLPFIDHTTSVFSNIMTAVTATTNEDHSCVRCAPQKGHWNGGDDVLMFVPKIDRRKSYEIYFEYFSTTTQTEPIEIEFVDSKTIAFKTPPCPIQANGNQTIGIPIVVKQNNEELARVNFLYQTADGCATCERNSMFDSFDESNTCEQSSTSDIYFDDSDTFTYGTPDMNY